MGREKNIYIKKRVGYARGPALNTNLDLERNLAHYLFEVNVYMKESLFARNWGY